MDFWFFLTAGFALWASGVGTGLVIASKRRRGA